MIGNEASTALTKPVKIISDTRAPSAVDTKVTVHYFQGGNYKALSVKAQAPAYFERLIVSSVFETTPVPEYSRPKWNSMRNIALHGLYASRRTSQHLRRPSIYPMPILDRRRLDPNNVAHLLGETIPHFLYARSIVGPDVTLLLGKIREPFSSLLRLFDIYPIHDTGRVTGNIIKIRGARGLSVVDIDGFFDGIPNVAILPDVYSGMDFSTTLKFDKVFLARRGPRSLENNGEIEKIAKKYGYKTVFMEDYSVREQLSMGAQARHVIALHGAAISFLLMSKKIDSVIELMPPNV